MNNPFDITGDVALVTGGGGGLGARFCTVLAANGARVVVADQNHDAANEVAEDLVRQGYEAIAVKVDVTDVPSIEKGFDTADSHFGTVTIAVGGAGTAAEKSALRITPEDWRAMMAVNLDGAWSTAQIAAQRMVRAKSGGAIINISSILGLKIHPRLAHYAVSKAGVIQMTKALAIELVRSGIRVNAIAPGSFETGMTSGLLASTYGKTIIARVPMRRAGLLNEMDGALLLLASKASGYMNGSILTIDGGHGLVIP